MDMFVFILRFAVSFFFFFKQKTAYEMRISDWSSDVCSSDLVQHSWRRGMSIRCAILSAAAILLAGSAGDPTIDREAAVTLEPMAKPASLPTELAWAGLGGGSEKLVSMENGVATWTQVEGNEARSEERRVGKEGVRTW